MDAAEFYLLWETALGWRELAEDEDCEPLENGPSRRDGKGFLDGKVCSLAVEVLPYIQHPVTISCRPLVTRTLNIWLSSFPGWHVAELQLLMIKPLTVLSGMGFVDVSCSPLPDKVVFSPYITIIFIFIILIVKDSFLHFVCITSSLIFSLNWLRYGKTLIRRKMSLTQLLERWIAGALGITNSCCNYI